LKVDIRKASEIDSPVVSLLAQVTFWESHGHSASKKVIDHYVQLHLNEQVIKSELKDSQNHYYIIFEDDVPAGFLKFRFDMEYKAIAEKHICKLDRIYVLESHLGKKLGLALMLHAIEIAKNSGQRGMWLYTWIENLRAVAFYQKHGFKIVDSADFKISDTHSNPNHIMYLEFDEGAD
jgi:diamine N-acetyltransferase